MDLTKLAALKEDVKLYPHQERAVNREGDALVIAHTVGAGKTLTGIARFEKLKEQGQAKKALVIVPSSLRHNFAEQGVGRFTDSKAQIVGGVSERKKGVNNDIDPSADYNIISYEMFRRDPEGYLKRSGADTIIADEFHKNKNEGTSTTESLKNLKGQYKNFIGLTGSVISNSTSDVQPLVDISTGGKHPLGETKKDFENRFLKRSKDKKYQGLADNRKPVVGFKHEKELRKTLGASVDYMDFDDIKDLAKMPDKNIQQQRIPLTKQEAKDYKRMVKNDPNLMKMVTNRRLETLKDDEVARSFNKMIEARKLMNSRATIEPGMSLSESAKVTSKTNRFLDDVEKHLDETPDGQAVLFSHLIHGGHDVLEQGLKDRGIEYGKFLGKGPKNGVTEESRQQDVRDYVDGKKRVMLISSAGGEGVSLGNTTYEGVLDGHYNPEKMNQMEARGVRSGGLSHRALKDRQVDINRYVSTMPRTLGLFKSKFQTPDEIVYGIAENKDRNNQLLYNLLKEEQRKFEKKAGDGMNRFLKMASEERSVGKRVNDVIDKRVKEMENKKGNRFLDKQASDLAEWQIARNQLFEMQDEAIALRKQNPNGSKQTREMEERYTSLYNQVYHAPDSQAHYVADVKSGQTPKAAAFTNVKNRFLNKQAGNLEEELHEQNYLEKERAHEQASDAYGQYPSSMKQQVGALGSLTLGGAALGAVGAHRIPGGIPAKAGAALGGLAGFAGYTNYAAPAISNRMDNKNPGRAEAREKMRSAFHDVMEAEY